MITNILLYVTADSTELRISDNVTYKYSYNKQNNIYMLFFYTSI